MPAAAVIPAPRAYRKVVAIKALVVGLLKLILRWSNICKDVELSEFFYKFFKRASILLI